MDTTKNCIFFIILIFYNIAIIELVKLVIVKGIIAALKLTKILQECVIGFFLRCVCENCLLIIGIIELK